MVIALAATTAGDLALAAWAGRARLAAERRVGCVAAVAAAVAAAATATLTVPAALGPAGWAGLTALTALAALVLAAGSRLADQPVAGTSAAAGLLVAVHAPEPYTVPAAAVLLAAGWHRSRARPQVSSWITYGPGLAVLMLPILAAVWLLPGWARPLALGVAAAGIALTGARTRLLAPLLLGGAVVILDAGHELAPAAGQLAGLLPRWVPIAVIGVALLAVGATYEARRRDLGRLRAALGRMR